MIRFGLIGVVAALALAPPARAQDFFSNLFGGFGRSRGPVIQMPFGDNFRQSQPRQRSEGAGQAYCVRTCDGRYFPIAGNDNDGREKACSSLCPTADTKVVYGSSIDSASTDNGKPYSKLPNAFRYRNELVAACTCNGKGATGLAQVSIENDPTLRKGDIVAGANGLVVASKTSDRRGASVEFSPASERIKDRYRAPPVVAKGRN
jgi:Protein of unknown function (DUF2865)